MDKKIIILEEFLSKEDLKYYKDYITKRRESRVIVVDPHTATLFWSKYKNKILEHTKTDKGISERVTYVRDKIPVKRHRDSIYDSERFKLLIYLNTVQNGGTIFHTPDKLEIENLENRAVLFDISLPHESQKFQSEIKYTIGFRIN